MAIYEVKIDDTASIADVVAVLNLMTITLESGDPVCDEFTQNFPHLVKDVTVQHKQVNQIAEAMVETGVADEENLS